LMMLVFMWGFLINLAVRGPVGFGSRFRGQGNNL
jgi:hypothetical protein